MKDPAEIESVIIGIFDDSQQMEEADKRLAAAGFEGAVYGAAFRADESCEVNPVAVGTLLAPGFVPPDGSEDRESGLSRIDAFRSRLAECHLRDEVIDAYATAYQTKAGFWWSEPNRSASNTSWRSCKSAVLLEWISTIPTRSSR